MQDSTEKRQKKHWSISDVRKYNMSCLKRRSLSFARRLGQEIFCVEWPRWKYWPKEEAMRSEQSPSETDVRVSSQPQSEGGKNSS